jgi:hypothetical protein
MKSKVWVCSTCKEVVRKGAPVTVPTGGCPRCGGIAFEVLHEDE